MGRKYGTGLFWGVLVLVLACYAPSVSAILDRMRSVYPHLISVKSLIGASVSGRPLYMVRISDNPNVDEQEPEVLLNALHHAREPIRLSQLIYFM